MLPFFGERFGNAGGKVAGFVARLWQLRPPRALTRRPARIRHAAARLAPRAPTPHPAIRYTGSVRR